MGIVSCGKSAAQKRYKKSSILVLSGMVFIFAGLAMYLWHHDPKGWMSYSLAALPSFPIVAMIVVVGRYLAEETDEFERDQTVRSILWGTGALLAVSTYLSFLREFGWTGHAPFLIELTVFCWAVVIARWHYRRSNRVTSDD
jgi:hypothetical protein